MIRVLAVAVSFTVVSLAFVSPAHAENTDSITTAQLTLAKAQQLAAESKGWLSLNGVTSLTDASIATALCSHQGGGLVLDGMTTLSPAAAAALSNYPGWLSLGGLSSLSTTTAQELAKHTGPGLYLNGVRSIDEAVAAKFSAHAGWLSLSGLMNTQYGNTNGNGNNAGNGNGNGNGNNAGSGNVAKNDGGLNKNIATQLAKHPGPLCLNGINDIDPATLGELAKGCRGGLDLSGLTSINSAEIMKFRNHSGWLALDGLTEIPDNVVDDLVAHDGPVGLLGLTTISGNATTAKQSLRSSGKVRLPAAMR